MSMEEKSKKIIIQLTESTAKGLIGAIPFAGTALNEALFDGRSRIKQERFNNFINIFSEYMKDVNESEIDFEYIKSEDFGDIFESIIRRVMRSGSEEKLKTFKNVLSNHVLGKIKTDHAETFLDLVSRLNEDQIRILETYRKIKTNDISIDENLPKRNVIDANFETQISELRSAKNFELDEGVYQFYLQDLFAKGLLFDNGVNRMDIGPFELMEITQFGIDFLSYIEQS
jgi:hypothetical protein